MRGLWKDKLEAEREKEIMSIWRRFTMYANKIHMHINIEFIDKK